MTDFEDTGLAATLASLRNEVEEPPVGFATRLNERLHRELRWREPVRRLARDRRTQVAAASLGGAVLGATAMAILWRRAARRTAAERVPA